MRSNTGVDVQEVMNFRFAGGQTANAMALELGIVPEDHRYDATQAVMFDINTGHKFLDVGVG